MNNIYKFLKRYLVVITVLITVSIVLSMSYSNFIVTSENHKVAEMYIGTLKYSMSIDGTNTNTLSVPNGETIIDVTINNENLIDTYYKLIYENNSNVTITYYEGYKLDNSNNISNSYDLPNDKLLNSGTKTLKLKIVNNSTTSKRIIFKVIGGFATNTLDDVTVPSEYTTIEKDTSTNTYFCTTTDTLTQGLKYVNGQYTYAYKQEGAYASSGLAWQDITSDGWGVQLTDKTSTNAVTSKVCTYINNKPIVSMYYMFYNSKATTLDVSNFNTSNVTDMSLMFSNSQATTLDVSNFDTSNVTKMFDMFYNSKATTLDVSTFDTSKVTNMNGMFYNSQVTTLDVSNFNTSNVTNMSWMFYNSQATTLDVSNFNTSKVTNMSSMFWSSQATTLDLSNFNTSNVTNMNSMFAGSKATTLDLSSFDTSKVTDMSLMFYNSKATTLDVSNFNTSKVTNMSSMFWSSQATTLDVSDFNTSNVTTMSGMFYNSQATTLDVSNFNTSKVTSMGYMFSGSQATTLDVSNFDTSKVTNMNDMFYGSTNLKTIYGSSKFVTTAVTNSTDMFKGATSLIGGAGTKYNSSYVDKTYARIDGGTSNPGYFTDIADKPSTFPTDSWETIVASVKAGNTRGYKVGETKTIDMGTYGTHTLRIANTSTPSECSTTGFSQTACGFVLEFADIITTHNMNGTSAANASNVGGWPATSMRTFVNNDIYNAIPSEIKNAIIDTTVVSGHGSKDTANFTSTDKLYLLAPGEVWSDWKTNSEAYYDTAKDLTRTLDYYTNIGVTISNNSGTIKKNGTNDDTWWWLRTAYSTNTSYFHFVRYSGDWINYDSSNTFGVAPAFRLG